VTSNCNQFNCIILLPHVKLEPTSLSTFWLLPQMTCGSCSLPVQELRERDAWASPVLLNFPLCNKRCRKKDGHLGRNATLKEMMAHPQSRTGAMAPIAVRHRHGNGPRTPTSPTVEELLRGNCINSNITTHDRRKG
jgi:hypothetical protein